MQILDPGSKFLSQLVHYRTYAATQPDGTKENKEQMFRRVEAMHLKKYPQLDYEIKESFDAVMEGLALPSMRSCQFAGNAIERENTRIYNCFGAETEFLTPEGIKKFSDCRNGEEITVLASGHQWKPAVVRSFGEQLLYKLTIRRGRSEQIIFTTADHNWYRYKKIHKDGPKQREIVSTLSLQKGDILPTNRLTIEEQKRDMHWSVCNIEKTDRIEQVWCVTEPQTSSFTLGCGVLTGNCSFLPINSITSISELFFILCCGAGVGLSVEKINTNKIDEISIGYDAWFVVPDSKEGWADSVKKLIMNPKTQFDYSLVRPEGSALSTGGTSSGPSPLKHCHEKIRTILYNARNRRLEPIECADICCLIADCVVVGSVRRSALLIMFDNDDEAMLCYKSGEWYLHSPHRARANISATIFRKDTKAKQSFNRILNHCFESGSGEPGIIWTNAPSSGWGLNPCLSGDTLVAVADGRNAVPIKDLIGTTYPVYAIKKGSVVIKQSIKTWKTRENAEIWELTLDDNSVLKATPDHKIMLRDGTYKELKDLIVGDSLMPFNSFVDKDKYRQIATNKGKGKFQYRMIAKYFNIKKSNQDVHHIDRNSFNDSPSNLMPMNRKEHAELHGKFHTGTNNSIFKIKDKEKWRQRLSENKIGLNNNKAYEIDNAALFLKAIEETKRVNRNLRIGDWLIYAKENHLPRKFSSYRKNELGTISEMLMKAAIEANVPITSKRIRRVPIKAKKIKIPLSRQEIYDRQLMSFAKKKAIIKNQQIDIYLTLKLELNRKPQKKEWVESCKQKNTSYEISRKSSPFKNWNELIKASDIHNHRVKSIKFLCYDDVYDMTVEEVHNFGVITSKEDDSAVVSSGIFIRNCVEASLRDFEFCNLTSTNAAACDNLETFLRAVKAATTIGTLQAGYDKLGYLRPEWRKNIQESRLLGVSMTGIAEAWDLLTSDVLLAGSDQINKINTEIAAKIGINPAARKGCVKPEGTGSAALGVSSGITAHKDEYFWRRVRMDKNHPLSVYLSLMLPAIFVEQDVMNPNNIVVNVPIAKPGSLTTVKESAIGLLEREKRIYQNWILPSHTSGLNTHNVSITVNYKEHEKEDIREWMWKNRQYYSGIALFPELTTIYPQLPFESMPKEKYEEVIKELPDLDLSIINYTEIEDDRKQEAACAGSGCEWGQ